MASPADPSQLDAWTLNKQVNCYPDVVHLINRLYNPATPAEVNDVQAQLQEVQRMSDWYMPDILMYSGSQNVCFFGASTFIVKINRDGAKLEVGEFEGVLHKMLKHLVRLAVQGEGPLVLRKMCSALVTLFLLPNSVWRRCLRHVVVCLHVRDVVQESFLDEYPSNDQLFPSLSFPNRVALLLFAKDLAEVAGRVEHTSQRLNYCHERVELNLSDAVAIINYTLSSVRTDLRDYQTDVLQCYESWMSYARQEYTQRSPQFQSLRSLLGAVSQCLFADTTFEAAAEFFTDLFSADNDLLDSAEAASFAQIFDTPWAVSHLAQLGDIDRSDETTSFGLLLSAFAQAISCYVVGMPYEYRNIVNNMHLITRSQRFETIDQSLSNACVDFWESFVAHVIDVKEFEIDEAGHPTSDTDSMIVRSVQRDLVQAEWLQAMEEMCDATTLPEDQFGELRQLRSDHAFSEFRGRVREAIQDSYGAFQSVVLEKLVDLALGAYDHRGIHPKPWGSVEAVFNCLGGLSETMQYERRDTTATADDYSLQRLFSSAMYAELTNFTSTVPLRLRKKAITIIGEQDEFLACHEMFLLSALEMLFSAVDHPELSDSASGAIFKLCNTNRRVLAGKVVPFMEISERFFVSTSAKPSTKKNVAAAIAAIAQALPLQHDRMQVMDRLLVLIERDYSSTITEADKSLQAEEDARMAKLSILEQLVAVGEASQIPDDVPVDLDAEPKVELARLSMQDRLGAAGEQSQVPDGVLDRDPAILGLAWRSRQERIVKLLVLLLAQSLHDGSIVEAAFNVLRTGYKETQPGPFVFDPKYVVDLIVHTPRENPRLDVAVSNAAALLSAHSTRLPLIQPAVPVLLTFLCDIVEARLVWRDPELSNACLEFMNRLIPLHAAQLFRLDSEAFTDLFDFSLTCLKAGEVLPKRSAANLWTSLLDATSGDAFAVAETILNARGRDLVSVLINNFGGWASRSQLDWITKPFRKLVFRHGGQPWKSWTERALMSHSFPSPRASEEDKRKFVKQVEFLRGDRKTNVVVKEFWLACSGTPTGYGRHMSGGPSESIALD